jgi:hypothetical protein
MAAAYRVHKLLQELSDPALAQQFLQDPESHFDRYGLEPVERQALREGTPQAMGALGVHPLLQMMLLFVRSPEMATQGVLSGVYAELRGH